MRTVTGGLTAATLAMIMLSGAHGGARQGAMKKQVVAHRGASAYAPEHTIDAYRLAMEQKADYVEQDLAVTKDGVLVCIHDLTLERTTDVEEVFPTRFVQEGDKIGSMPAGKHWLVGDFTLAELKKLDAGSWFNAKFAGARIPTFQEAIDLVGDRAGLYPELKDPAFYRERGVNPDALLAAILKKNKLVVANSTRIIIQSFDDTTLQKLAVDLPDVPRVYLVGVENVQKIDTAEKVAAIARWATGVAPNKAIISARPELVQWAHAAKLTVTPWTFRAASVGAGFASVGEEMDKFLNGYGVDALFTDNPDLFPRR
jgi:glycerophosphoryl diester phosphodiesterase